MITQLLVIHYTQEGQRLGFVSVSNPIHPRLPKELLRNLPS